jgi:hypothetical protein
LMNSIKLSQVFLLWAFPLVLNNRLEQLPRFQQQ